MSTLYITEFATQGRDLAGYTLQNGTPREPVLAEQTVAIGAGSLQSVAFNPSTTIVRLHTDAICSIAVGLAPVATATKRRMAANTTEQIAMQPGSGFQIAVITNV